MELFHHGVKGQKWGVKNGPPYPLTKVTKGTPGTTNDIYDTLDKHQKYLIANNAKVFIREKDAKYLVDQTVLKIKDIPVSAFDVWNQGNGNVSISIQTRAGYQGKGYANKTVQAGLDAIEKYKDVKMIYWGAYSKNTGSRKLAENNGFELIEDDGRWARYKKPNN